MDIQEVRLFLKKNFHGPEVRDALRFRLKTHLTDPLQDPLSSQVWGAYQKLLDIVGESFSILDCGCMSGFLYHHLKRHKQHFHYVGIDRWKEAIEVGKEFAPALDLRVADFLTFKDGKYDFVWCSNIPWRGNDFGAALKNLLPLAKRKLIFAHPGDILEIYGA